MFPGGSVPCDEDLVRRLPLPLAPLYRRALNAKSALERHQAAYYLWEAELKLLSSDVAAYPRTCALTQAGTASDEPIVADHSTAQVCSS